MCKCANRLARSYVRALDETICNSTLTRDSTEAEQFTSISSASTSLADGTRRDRATAHVSLNIKAARNELSIFIPTTDFHSVLHEDPPTDNRGVDFYFRCNARELDVEFCLQLVTLNLGKFVTCEKARRTNENPLETVEIRIREGRQKPVANEDVTGTDWLLPGVARNGELHQRTVQTLRTNDDDVSLRRERGKRSCTIRRLNHLHREVKYSVREFQTVTSDIEVLSAGVE